MKYIYNKELAILGKFFCEEILEDNQESSITNGVEYIGEEPLDSRFYYCKEENKFKEKTEYMLYQEGYFSLGDGEKFEDKKLIKIERPSQYHNWNGSDWVVDIDEVKRVKREELKRIREEKISENLNVNGDEFQVKEKDLQNFYNLKIVVDLDSSKANEKINWVLANNTIKEFSYSELMNVLTTYILRKQDIFTEFGKLSIKLQNLKTVEEIENLKWE